MNKRSLASVLACFAAGASIAAQAQSPAAQTPPKVELYGIINATLESVRADGGAGVPSRNRVSNQASRLGVRGSEDLGGGLSAFFQLETGFAPDAASGTFANRNSGVGLQGSWGTLLIGRWDTPYKVAANRVDPFNDVTLAGFTTTMHDNGNFNRREANVVQYWSPKLGDFQARVHYAANEGRSTTVNPSSNGISIYYDAKAIYLAASHEEHKDQSGSTVAAAGRAEKGRQLIGRLRHAGWELGVMLEKITRKNQPGKKAALVALTYETGPHEIKGYVGRSDVNGGETEDAKITALGYQYTFSKRSNLYLVYANIKNESGAANNFGQNDLNIVNGQDPRGFGIGMRHSF
jgi:predicted porin